MHHVFKSPDKCLMQKRKLPTVSKILTIKRILYQNSFCFLYLYIPSYLIPFSHLSRFLRKIEKCQCVTLCRWSAKQTIPLAILARNQTKFWACDLDASGSRKRRPGELDKGTERRQLAKGDASGSRHRTAERPVGWDRVQPQREKTSQDESALLVGCRIFARNPRLR